MLRIIRLIGAVALVLCSSTVYAQATRTWISGVGDDANPCSRTAPCKTFAGAISKTAAGGVIDALDPGGFGALTITKPITIEGSGTLASILASGTNGIIVNITGVFAMPRLVVIRDILINGAGTTLGLNGVRFLAGDALVLERVKIQQFSNFGVDFEPSGGGQKQLEMRDCSIIGATNGGVFVKPVAGTSARVSIAGSAFSRNQYGVRVEDNTIANVYDSVAHHNTNNGFLAVVANTGPSALNLEQTTAANNGTNGVATNGANSIIRLADCNITGNVTGINTTGGGTIASWQNNYVSGNTSLDGAPNALLTKQ